VTSQAHALALQPSKLLAVNVNGLAAKAKRRAFFKHVLSAGWDVVVLSETHCGGPEVAAKWLKDGAGPGKPWLGQAFWSHGTSASRGVAVLLRQGFAPKAKVEFADGNGRLLRVGWECGSQGRPVSVVAVYAPSDGEASRSVFFAPDGPLRQAVVAGSGTSADLLIGGDFNCRVPVADDVAALPADVQRLQALVAAAGLRDAWAAARGLEGCSPEEAWTFLARGSGRTSSARLDYWFVPCDRVQQGWVARCGHRWDAAAPGDHAAVALEWRCPDATPRGKSRWMYPNLLLRDQGFVAAAKVALSGFLDSWQPDGAQQEAFPAGARWEAVKQWLQGHALHELKQKALQFASERRLALKAERRARVRAAAVAAPEAAEAYQSWQAAVKRLHAASMARQADDLIAGGVPLDVLWDACGEQSTGWFHRLMPRRQEDAGLAGGPTAVRVQLPGGASEVVSVHNTGGLARVGDALSAFFDGNAGGLFAPSVVHSADQDVLLAAVDRFVPPEEVVRCRGPAGDGLVTTECLSQALKGTTPGKAPGSDGLTYEVYKAFWDVLQQPLVACFNEAFQGLAMPPELAGEVRLTESQRLGIIVLLYKGGDKPVDDVASYRPITLLNTDVKLLARVLVNRMSAGLDAVVDATQTAFIPGRWIGDNVLFHLEEIDYCQAERVPACVVFLDFEKAYDRLDRGWLFRCLDRVGFPEELSRWVQLMLKDAEAMVLYHGYLSPRFAVLSGVAQGSPLSPQLYLVAAQPLAARLRQLQAEGRMDAVRMPDGSDAPPSHQHADDTTIHTKTPQGAAVALQHGVVPFGRASGAVVNVGKSLGMLLGLDDSEEVREQARVVVGVPFVAPEAHTRHLGILLSAGDVAGAAKAMFAKRRAGVLLRVRAWARFNLSYLGRVHVAKQVLANTFSYHATFVAPPWDMLQQVVEIIDLFVVMGRVMEADQAPPLRQVPSAAVESLPWALGGLRRADIPAHSMALNAKVAAALLHPRRHPWKVLMRRAFQRMVPRLGVAALVSQLRPVACAGRPARLMGYWKAFYALQPHRLVPATVLPVDRVLAEQLLHNAQVKGFTVNEAVLGKLPDPLVPVLGPCPTMASVRAVLQAGGAGLTHTARQWVPKVRALLPLPWGAMVDLAVLPESRWLASTCGSWACRGQEFFPVRLDGRLGKPEDVQQLAPGVSGLQWCEAAVVWCPVAKGQELLVEVAPDPHLAVVPAFAAAEGEACQLQAWLMPGVGPGESQVDPNVWGVGRLPVSSFVVSAATDRLKVLGMARLKDEFVPCEGVRPRLFAVADDPNVGLAAMEAVQGQAYKARWQALAAGHQVQPRNVRPRLPEDERGCCPLYEAAWMRASVARLHPCERAAQRLGLVAGGHGQARVDDGVDAVAGYNQTRRRAWKGEGKAPWLAAFEVVRLARLARPLRFFGWLLTHGALRCGGAMVTWRQSEDGFDVGDFVEMCACGAEECLSGASPAGEPPPCETLSHVFVECPVVKPAVEWLRHLWSQLGDATPPLDAQVLVVGDKSVWSAGGKDAWELWTHLRLEFCRAVWRLTARRTSTGQVFTAAAVVEMTAAELERSICLDWARVGAGQGNSVEDKRVRLESEDFDVRWLKRGVLADRDNGTLQVHVPRSMQPAT